MQLTSTLLYWYLHVVGVILLHVALCDGGGGLFSRAVVHIVNACMNSRPVGFTSLIYIDARSINIIQHKLCVYIIYNCLLPHTLVNKLHTTYILLHFAGYVSSAPVHWAIINCSKININI